MLYLCHGNQLEDLADRLVLDLTRPVKDVLAPDLIAVPGQGIVRWLSLRLAHQQGIIANTLWQFPAELLWHLFRTRSEERSVGTEGRSRWAAVH